MRAGTSRDPALVPTFIIHNFWMLWLFTIQDTFTAAAVLVQPRFYVAIICVLGRCERGLELYNSWKHDEKPYNKDVRIQYYSPHTVTPNLSFITTILRPSAAFGRPPRVHWRYIFYANFIAAKKFLEDEYAMWFLRTTYDVYISWKNLWRLFSELDSKYDAAKDKVFVGQVIAGMRYIHGGPGWIMSRAAVEEYVRDETRLTVIYNKKRVGDDVNIVQFVKRLNLTAADVHTSQFVGPPLHGELWPSLIEQNFNFSSVGKCPEKTNKFELARVNRIALLHNGHKMNYVAAYGKQLIETAPPNLYILSKYHWSILCTDPKTE